MLKENTVEKERKSDNRNSETSLARKKKEDCTTDKHKVDMTKITENEQIPPPNTNPVADEKYCSGTLENNKIPLKTERKSSLSNKD